MQGLTPASAREFLESGFWKEWQELTNQLTFERWLSAKQPKQQLQLRLQIDHLSVAEEALIRLSCQDRDINQAGQQEQVTGNSATMN